MEEAETHHEGAGAAPGPRQNPLIPITAWILTGFVVWTAVFGQLPNIRQRAVVLGLTLLIGYLVLPLRGRAGSILGSAVDALALVSVAAGCTYVFVQYEAIMLAPGAPSTVAVVLGTALIVAVFELARRAIGISFAVLMVLFSAYALFGHLIPGRLGHAPAPPELLVDMLYLGTDGLWGPLLDIYVSILVLFVLFSSLMLATGAGQTFIDIAKLIGGRSSGGPAKIAVFASSLIGSMTGSSVANVAMTGTVTIPTMKRLGYRPEMAAAIEATASSGGQITPPLMGAGLFLMAEMLQIDIGRMMLIALVPAGLFYLSVFAAVHFESKRAGIDAVPDSELPDPRALWRWRTQLPLVAPFLALLGMVAVGFSVDLAVVVAILTLVATFILCARSTADAVDRVRIVGRAIGESGSPLVMLGALIAAAALLVGIIGFFGIGSKFSDLVLSVSDSSLLLSLVLAGVIVMVIGMGVPTTAAYVLGASVIAIALQRLGVDELSAHMFIYYFATLSALTPPVCAAVFVAAGIADAPWLRVAWHTCRLAAVKYLLPFMFVYHPEVLLVGEPLEILAAIATASIGAVFLGAAFAGFLVAPLSGIWRALICIGALAALWPELTTSLLGILAVLAASGMNLRLSRQSPRETP